MSVLEIQSLSIKRGVGTYAHHVDLPDLKLSAGDVVAVTGESGCGKSTLLECIGLLLAPDTLGTYRLGCNGLDIKSLLDSGDQTSLAEVRARDLGFVLQNGGLLPYLSVQDNIALPRRLLGLPGAGAYVEQAIDILRLTPLLSKRPQALSIGERQRVAFVRAISHDPGLILADEPTAALDPISARILFELFLGMVSDMGIAALVVSHDWTLVDSFGLRCLTADSSPGRTVFLHGD